MHAQETNSGGRTGEDGGRTQGSLLQPVILLGAVLLAVLALLSSCVGGTTARPLVEIQSEVSTAVAATLSAGPQAVSMEAQVATEVARQVAAQLATQAAAASPVPPTPTPVPTEAPPTATATPVPVIVPSATPQATAPAQSAAAPAPEITANANTNCRLGPDTAYKVISYLMKGQSSFVYGQDAAGEWWYIQNPTSSQDYPYCWVWSGSTVVEGGAADMPVVSAPPLNSSTKASSNYYDYGSTSCSGWCGDPYGYNTSCGYNYFCAPVNCNTKRVCTTKKVLICPNPNKCTWKVVTQCDFKPACTNKNKCGSLYACTGCFPVNNWQAQPTCKTNRPDNGWCNNVKWYP